MISFSKGQVMDDGYCLSIYLSIYPVDLLYPEKIDVNNVEVYALKL